MSFYRLEAGDGLPGNLRRDLPDTLWIPPEGPQPVPAEAGARVLLAGCPIGDVPAPPVPLVSSGPDNAPRAHFDIARAIEGTLLERYHDGLEPPAEMRLPFNYSRLPPWIKGCARFLRRGGPPPEPKVPFPSGDPSFVADWLHELARWTNSEPCRRTASLQWPQGRRAALAISHDVDTDWLFHHPEWIDRICDMEAAHGLFGAWYCVPAYSQTAKAAAGIERLIERGCEVGCHGYNHDAKWPLLSGPEFERRARAVAVFRDRWRIRGFRSEWLWRTPSFLAEVARLFDYDSSVPTVAARFTSRTRNGCGTGRPYRTHGGLIELPLTLPMDEDRHGSGLDLDAFWCRQIERARMIIDHGGMAMLSLHPQPHQAANPSSLKAIDAAIREIVKIPNLWIARPDRIADWVRDRLPAQPAASP